MKKLLLILMTVMVTTLAAKAQVKPTVLGEYIASQLQGKGRVMEIMGLEGSSPAIERHNGFALRSENRQCLPAVRFATLIPSGGRTAPFSMLHKEFR